MDFQGPLAEALKSAIPCVGGSLRLSQSGIDKLTL
jgi:hypothetical protein